jgi:hypothetical protein
MPAIGMGHPQPTNLKKMTRSSLISGIVILHLFALLFVIIAIGQIRLHPSRIVPYAILIPAILLLSCAYKDCLGELLRRRREKKI